VGILAVIAALGLTMFTRWIPVQRAFAAAESGPVYLSADFGFPAEPEFPVSVVAGHGVLAVATVTLVLPTMLPRLIGHSRGAAPGRGPVWYRPRHEPAVQATTGGSFGTDGGQGQWGDGASRGSCVTAGCDRRAAGSRRLPGPAGRRGSR
jgi:hypothetical protein